MTCYRGPALVIDAAIAEHLEVLRFSPFRGVRIVQAVKHTHALHRHLRDSIDGVWFGQLSRFENGRRDIDHMMELMAHLALGLDALGPMNHCTITSSAPVRCYLLGPLVRRIHRMRP